MSSTTPIIGIDLGTTNSLVAIYDDKGPRVLKDGEFSLVPSVIYFDKAGNIQAVGQRAKTLKSLDPQHVLYSVKRFMGKGLEDINELKKIFHFDFSPSTSEMVRIRMGEKNYSPIELSAEILKKCRFVAENALGCPVRKAVITVPAYFNDAQRSATTLAGKIAGLEVLRILNEPTAAALAYGIGKNSKAQKIAVYDFGGGTFDISILKVTEGTFEVLSTDGDTQLGGDDLDHAIAEFLILKSNKRPSTEEDWTLLLAQAERLKINLSSHESVEIQLHWNNQIQWSGSVSKQELRAVMQPIVERTIVYCQKALKAADLKKSEIDEIVMVGGSSRLPLVRKLVEEFFGKALNISVNPDEVVALGAAVQGSILGGEITDTLLLDVVPLSLGIETLGGIVSKIIHRNSTVPIAFEEMFTTSVDNQTGVDLHILQGERELAKDCRSLGKFRLKIPPALAGSPKISVRFQLDANGILKVHALDTKSNEQTSLDVKPSFGLTDMEVEKMLQDAWTHAESDFEKRKEIETKNQAQTLILSVQKSLQNPLIDPEFKKSQLSIVQPIINALQEDLKSAKIDIIELRTKELDFRTQELAKHIMDQNVSAILRSKSIETIQI